MPLKRKSLGKTLIRISAALKLSGIPNIRHSDSQEKTRHLHDYASRLRGSIVPVIDLRIKPLAGRKAAIGG